MDELNNFERFDEITELTCLNCNLTEIPVLPKYLRLFDCGYNQIREIKNLPESLQEFYYDSNQITEIKNLPVSLRHFNYEDNPITNPMEIKKWEYICQKNLERDEYITKYFSIPNIGIELGGNGSFLLIPHIDDTLGSLLYLENLLSIV